MSTPSHPPRTTIALELSRDKYELAAYMSGLERELATAQVALLQKECMANNEAAQAWDNKTLPAENATLLKQYDDADADRCRSRDEVARLRADLTLAREERDKARAERNQLLSNSNSRVAPILADRDRLAAELKEAKEHLEGVQGAFKSAQSQRNELHAELEQEQNLSALNLENNDRLITQLDQSKREAAAMREALETTAKEYVGHPRGASFICRKCSHHWPEHSASCLVGIALSSTAGQDFIPRVIKDENGVEFVPTTISVRDADPIPRAAREELKREMNHPSTKTVHTVNGPVQCCDKHAQQLANLMRFMGAATNETAPIEGAECANCVNEAKAREALGSPPK